MAEWDDFRDDTNFKLSIFGYYWIEYRIGKHDVSYFASYCWHFRQYLEKRTKPSLFLRFLAWQIACRKIARDDPIILTFCLPALKNNIMKCECEFSNQYVSFKMVYASSNYLNSNWNLALNYTLANLGLLSVICTKLQCAIWRWIEEWVWTSFFLFSRHLFVLVVAYHQLDELATTTYDK